MAQMSPLFQESRQLDEYELVNSLTNKAPKSHKSMLISQGLNLETVDLETSAEHCEQAETTDNIAGAKFTALDEDSDTKRNKKRLKSKDEHGKKLQKQHSKLYCYIHGENSSQTTREWNVLKVKVKEKPKFSKKDYTR